MAGVQNEFAQVGRWIYMIEGVHQMFEGQERTEKFAVDMNELVRASREGDRYHHLYGARYAIELIQPLAALSKIAVEGASSPTPGHPNADYAIDLALYRGTSSGGEGEELIQFKYSTRNDPPALTAIGVAKTIRGWANRFSSNAGAIDKLRITTNRPFSGALVSAVRCLADGRRPRNKAVLRAVGRLKAETAILGTSARRKFFSTLQLDSRDEDTDSVLMAFRRSLGSHGVSPSSRRDKERAVIDLVESKAGYRGRNGRNVIDASDVLARLQVDSVNELYPCPDAHELAEHYVERSCTPAIAASIVSDARPCVVHAVGGLGKSEQIRRVNAG